MAMRPVVDHPKFAYLCRLLKICKWEALGVLEGIWQFTARYTPQGNVGKYSDQDIADWLEWESSAEFLVECLVSSHWVERNNVYRLVIHDWSIHADMYVNTYLASKLLPFWDGTVPKCGRLNPALRKQYQDWIKYNGFKTIQGKRAFEEDSSAGVPQNLRRTSADNNSDSDYLLDSNQNEEIGGLKVPLSGTKTSKCSYKPEPKPEPRRVPAPEKQAEPLPFLLRDRKSGERRCRDAQEVLEGMGLVYSAPLLRRMQDALLILCDEEKCIISDAQERMKERMLEALEDGPQKWLLWLEDGKWKKAAQFRLAEEL